MHGVRTTRVTAMDFKSIYLEVARYSSFDVNFCSHNVVDTWIDGGESRAFILDS